jgi:uracil permease
MKNLLKNIYYGALHTLVAFTSIVVVTNIVGFNLANSFLFVGVGTLIFHLVTKNKIASVMGVSGSYIAGMIYVTKNFGLAYTLGGVIISAIMYILFSLIMFKYQNKLLKYFPDWILSIAVMMIGLTLIPIGKTMIMGNILIGLIALVVTALISLFGKNKISMFAVPIGILVATTVLALTTGIDLTPLSATHSLQFIVPKFNLASLTAIGIIGFTVLLELLGDVKNTGSCMKKDLFKEVGVGKIALGNGLASLISGFGSSLPITTYSENASFLLLSGYTNPTAQIITSIIFILLSFINPLLNLISLIPSFALGGVALFLYAMITINAIRDLAKTEILKNKREFTIISIMLSMFFIDFAIGGVTISSVAIATIVGLLLNAFLPKTEQE